MIRAFLTLTLLATPASATTLIEPEVSTLRLRAQATIHAGPVTLADVLDFSEAAPQLREAIGGQHATAAVGQAGSTLVVSHEQVVQRLTALGVNLSRVLVGGALRCRVTVLPPPEPPAAVAAESAAPLLRAGVAVEPADGPHTLAAALRAHVARELKVEPRQVELVVDRASADFAQLTSPPFDFSIQSLRGGRLGLREFRVNIRRDGRLHHTLQIGAEARLMRRVVVAARPLNIGTQITRDGIELAERIFSDESAIGLDTIEPLVGQQVARFVAAGQMLTQADVQSVELVKRARPVTVISDGVVAVRAVGMALDSGGYGDSIRVRLGESRRERRELRGVVVGVSTVRIDEEGM